MSETIVGTGPLAAQQETINMKSGRKKWIAIGIVVGVLLLLSLLFLSYWLAGNSKEGKEFAQMPQKLDQLIAKVDGLEGRIGGLDATVAENGRASTDGMNKVVKAFDEGLIPRMGALESSMVKIQGAVEKAEKDRRAAAKKLSMELERVVTAAMTPVEGRMRTTIQQEIGKIAFTPPPMVVRPSAAAPVLQARPFDVRVVYGDPRKPTQKQGW